AEIEEKTQSDLNRQQKEYYLHQEMKVIQEELGGPSATDDVEELRDKADKLKMPKQARSVFDAELSKLQRTNPQNADYNVQLNYLQTVVALPWGQCTKDNLNLQSAERTLNRDHYGMEKVKERILEHLAVLKLRGDNKSPILCLYGPPGVGKTSLGKSIARALKRRYVRASLGGLHDEAEIRGHRRTYIGAMPGRIIKGLAKAGSSNPVFILDEIDKISGQTINGDPSSALLEVLDPEQNVAFHDNFLEIDYDLSNVMFIATANDISSIPRALLDRMELIEVSGYCTEEKIEIARKHLIPKAKENNGLSKEKGVKIKREAIEFLIERYTRESGVRGLEKQLNKVFRKIALGIAKGEGAGDGETVDTARLAVLLGKELFNRDIYQGNEIAGVVTGLAWTSVGGEILFIETSLSPGKGGKLTVTGNLGDVMKESAMLAVEFIKAHTEELGIDPRLFEQWHVHVHVPEGATPKDGPSAGITMVTSIVSCVTQRKVRDKMAMTGEITLRGKVLPVGGIKEKILAAKRAGVTDIVICKDNRKDIGEIPPMYLKGMTFHYVDTILDVLAYALLPETVKNAKLYKIEDDLPARKD
ncbi:MAG: endopeptidase La, partial [Prevotellaceae bacterium]|nr:endopeptidase La [Prevotellaceae bacterium]